MSTSTRTEVFGETEEEYTQVQRKGRFLFFFKTEWWETVSTQTVGNDIHIQTTKPIRHIYLNGELINKEVTV